MSNPRRLDQINQIGYYDYGYQYENKEKPITKKFLTPDGYVTTNTLFAEQQKDSEQDRYMCREKKYELVARGVSAEITARGNYLKKKSAPQTSNPQRKQWRRRKKP